MRKIIQLSFLGIATILVILLFFDKLPICHAFCPYAPVCFGITSIQIHKFVFPISVIGGILILFSSIIFGRKFCGYFCPLGTFQEYLYKINPDSKNKQSKQISYKVHKVLSSLKYILLFVTVITAILTIHHHYIRYCPIYAISHIKHLTVFSAFTLLLIMIGGFFVERFWCRYLCPMAALFNFTQWIGQFLKIPRFMINRSKDTCINCKLCTKNCPMGITLDNVQIVKDVNCIHCYQCIQICPKDNALCEKCK